jgi:hypothetical protein
MRRPAAVGVTGGCFTYGCRLRKSAYGYDEGDEADKQVLGERRNKNAARRNEKSLEKKN